MKLLELVILDSNMITYTENELINLLHRFACYLTGYSSLDPAYHDGKFVSERRYYGNDWPKHAITMIGVNRLMNIQKLLFDTIKNNVPGHFIETGVWRGGACIFAVAIFKLLKITDKNVYVCDSFEGLPKPDPSYTVDNNDTHYTFKELAVSLEEVKNNFRIFGLLDDQVKFIKGWFCDTLPNLTTTFSVIRLDGDMYGSTMDSLNNLYHKLSYGGYCIIDDYMLKGAKLAVDDFRSQHNIQNPLNFIDTHSQAVYWQKTN